MNLLKKAVALLLAAAPCVTLANEDFLNDLLLENAMPLKEYESKVIAAGGDPFVDRLERELGGDDDDGASEYFSYKKSLSFNGYALKYATCQKIQRYSVSAVQRGEYSSMVTDNVVIMRLCPKKTCNSNSQYGCSSGFGEYAIDVSVYMGIVMRYMEHKETNFCSFCKDCAAENGNFANDDDSYNATSSSGSSSSFYKYTSSGQMQIYDSNTCYTYSSQCKNVIGTCNGYYDDDDNGNSTSTYDYLSYLDSFGCQQMNGYYLAPQCDTKNNAIEMGIFYDDYCNDDASSAVDVTKILDEDYDTDIFSMAQDVGCLDCQSSRYPPYYNAHNLFCSNIYYKSGQCDTYLEYDLGFSYGNNYYNGDDNAGGTKLDDETQCSFIESIRYGTYDTNGDIYTSILQTSTSKGTVTGAQQVSLIGLSLMGAGLAVYSCILHHQMTNLLLKSLSSGLVGAKKKRWVRRDDKSSDDYSQYSSATSSSASTYDASTYDASTYA